MFNKKLFYIFILFLVSILLTGSVYAGDVPKSNFTSNVTNGISSTSIQFNDTSKENPTSWSWDFGDGGSSSVRNPIHKYTKPGRYNVSLITTNSFGTNKIFKENYISIFSSSALPVNNTDFETGDTSGWDVTSGVEVNNINPHSGKHSVFIDIQSIPLTSISQKIDFSSIKSFSFWVYSNTSVNKSNLIIVSFDNKGSKYFNAKYGEWTKIIVDTENIMGSRVLAIKFRAMYFTGYLDDIEFLVEGNSANFSFNVDNEHSKVNFTDNSAGWITDWLWDFGDGSFSTERNPSHKYTNPGSYNVKLTVFGNGSESSKVIDNVITVLGPIIKRTGVSYKSIQEAVDAAIDGDIIEVGSKLYAQTFKENIIINKKVSIVSIGDVILNPLDLSKPVISLVNGADVLLDNLTINGKTGVSVSDLAKLTIKNCNITGNDIGLDIDNGIVNVFNNTISGNGVGVKESKGEANLKGNVISKNQIGIDVNGGVANIHFNNIYNNSVFGLKFVGNGVDASNNWWGTNTPKFVSGLTVPSKADVYEAQDGDNKVHDPWIVLKVVPGKDKLKKHDKTNVSVDFNHNSRGEDTSNQGTIPELPVKFYYSLGTLTVVSTTTSSGRAKTTVSSLDNKDGTSDFVVDVLGYTLGVPISVDSIHPKVSITPGGLFKDKKTVIISCDDSKAKIYYTLDGSDPKVSKTRKLYVGAFSLTKTTSVKVSAVDLAGNWADIFTSNYQWVNGTAVVSPWPGYQNGGMHTGNSSLVGPKTNVTLWNINGVSVKGSAVVGRDGTVYIGAQNGRLYAVNKQGNVIWYYETRSNIVSSPTIGRDGNIYFANWMNSTLYKISPKGKLLWRYVLGGYNTGSSPVVSPDNTVYVISGDSKKSTLFAFTNEGKLKWKYDGVNSHSIAPIWGFNGMEWVEGSFPLNATYGSTPTIGYDGTIYLMDGKFTLHAINPDGTLRWNQLHKLPSMDDVNKYRTMSVDKDGSLYVLNARGMLIKINGFTGEVIWNLEHREDIIGTISIKNGILYAISAGNRFGWHKPPALLAMSSKDGSILWRYELDSVTNNSVSSPVIGADGIIYFGANSTVYALKSDGSLLWKYKFTGKYGDPVVYGSPSIGLDRILYVTTNQGVFAFKDHAADFREVHVPKTDLTYKFTDLSSKGAVKWLWKFGDGKTSALQNPTHKYAKEGKYTVILSVTFSNGDVLVRNKTITVSKADIVPPSDVSVSLKGGSYSETQKVALSASDDRGVVSIYYTTDGSNPRTSVNRKLYFEPIFIETSMLLRFVAVDPSDNWGRMGSESYEISDVIYVQDASKYNSATMNGDIQKILDNAKDNSKIVFLGKEYKGLNLVLNKPLNLLSVVSTKIILNNNKPAFLINGLQAKGSIISGFNISNAAGNGIVVRDGRDVSIRNVRVHAPSGSGILVDNSVNTNIKDCNVYGSGVGVDIVKSNNTVVNKSTVTGNGLKTNGDGILIKDSRGSQIINNNISNNWYAIRTSNITDTLIYNNTIKNNERDGVRLNDKSKNTKISTNFMDSNNNGIHINGDYSELLIEKNVIIRSQFREGVHAYYSGNGILFGEQSSGNPSIRIDHNLFLKNAHRPTETRYGKAPHVEGNSDKTYIPGTNLWEFWNCGCTDIYDSEMQFKITRIGDGTYKLQLYDPHKNQFVTGLPAFDVVFGSDGYSQMVQYINGEAIATFDLGNLINDITADVYGQTDSQKWDMPGSGYSIKDKDSGFVQGPAYNGYGQGTGTDNGNGDGTGSGTGEGSETGDGSTPGTTTGTSSGTNSAGGLISAVTGSSSGGSTPGGDSGKATTAEDTKTSQELVINEVSKKFNSWGLLAILLLIIMVLLVYYRNDIKDMIKK